MENTKMTAYETKARIEKELSDIKESFGDAKYLVECDVQMGENEIEGDVTDITYIFGSLSLGTPDMTEDERLYLPLDAELDDNDNVDDEAFERSLAEFKEKVFMTRDCLLASSDYDSKIKEIITTFDEEITKKLTEEREKLEADMKKRLIMAAIITGVVAVATVAILVIQKLA